MLLNLWLKGIYEFYEYVVIMKFNDFIYCICFIVVCLIDFFKVNKCFYFVDISRRKLRKFDFVCFCILIIEEENG